MKMNTKIIYIIILIIAYLKNYNMEIKNEKITYFYYMT